MEQQPEYAAFPQVEMRDQYGMLVPYRQTGMTLRDYFAGQALPSIVDHYHLPHSAAKLAYEYADAMLEAREEKP